MALRRSTWLGLLFVAAVPASACESAEEVDSSTHHATYAAFPHALAADQESLYVATGSTIERRDLAGADPKVIVDALPDVAPVGARRLLVSGLEATSNALYWMQHGDGVYRTPTALVRAPKEGGAPEVLIPAETSVVLYVVTSASIFACSESLSSGGPTLWSAAMAEIGEPITFGRRAFGGTGDVCRDLFVDAQGIVHLSVSESGDPQWYVVDRSMDPEREAAAPVHPGVRWIAKEGATELTLVKEDGAHVVLTTGSGEPYAFDAAGVYLKTGLGGGNRRTRRCESGSISFVREGRAPTIVTEAQCYPSAFALTKERVFWLDDVGSIMKSDGSPESVLKSLPR